jgi:hypothetical protein
MIVYTIKINDREYEILEDFKDTYTIMSNLIIESEMPLFYGNYDDFMTKFVSIKREEAFKKLYFISTNQTGYDTYDSAVYCAYTDKQAKEMSEQRMNYKEGEYNNKVSVIGTARTDVEIGEVVSSFNAG